MGLFILLFLGIGCLEFFLVTRPGRWRFSAVILPASAFFFWMDRQSYWTDMEPEAVTVEIMLVGTWAAASVMGAAAGLLRERRRNKRM